MTGSESAAPGSSTARVGRAKLLAFAVALMLGALGVGLLALPGTDATPTPRSTASSPKIVSLSPAITQWVMQLGHADALVGVGDGDAVAPAGRPSVGTFFDVDLERLAGLAPTVVLAATAPAKLPPALRAAAERDGVALAAWPYPATLDEAVAVGRKVGGALGDAAAGAAAAAALRQRLEAVGNAVAGQAPVRTLLLFSTEPLMACGVGTVHDELLTLAGGVNVLDAEAGTAPTLDRELLRGLAPDAVLVMRPGAAPQGGDDDPRLAMLAGLGLPAVANGRVVLLNDPAVLLSGPAMDTTAVSFAVALHPQRAEAVAEAYAAVSGLPLALPPTGSRPGGQP